MYKFQTHESDADDSDVLRLVQNVWYLGPLTITMFNWPWQELSRLRTGQPKEIKRRFVLRLEFFARVFWLWKMCQKSLNNKRLTLFTRTKFGNPSKFYSSKWRVPWWYNTRLTACSQTAAIDESNCTLKSSLANTPLGRDWFFVQRSGIGSHHIYCDKISCFQFINRVCFNLSS